MGRVLAVNAVSVAHLFVDVLDLVLILFLHQCESLKFCSLEHVVKDFTLFLFRLLDVLFMLLPYFVRKFLCLCDELVNAVNFGC
jgi:hypothetical protein